jgi:4'-phosphopantetheinyl transferase
VGELHVWAVRLGVADYARSVAILDATEQARAARFRFEPDRVRFAVARATLRERLAGYLGVAPGTVAFGVAPKGKPFLAAPESTDLQFNVSHSGDVALLGFARGFPVGVDVERCRPDVAVLDLAQRFFAPAEADAVRAASPEARLEVFYRCWSRKEAVLKATGEGLALALDSFIVGGGTDARTVYIQMTDTPRLRVTVQPTPFLEGHRAAVAWCGEAVPRVSFFSLGLGG